MVFRFDAEIFEDGIGPEAFHVVLPIVRLWCVRSIEISELPSFRFGHVGWDSGVRSLWHVSKLQLGILTQEPKHAWTGRSRKRLITDEEIEIFCATLS